jgi:hypothetical protein
MTAADRDLLSCRVAAGFMLACDRDRRRAANPARAFSASTPRLPSLSLTLPSPTLRRPAPRSFLIPGF